MLSMAVIIPKQLVLMCIEFRLSYLQYAPKQEVNAAKKILDENFPGK